MNSKKKVIIHLDKFLVVPERKDEFNLNILHTDDGK